MDFQTAKKPYALYTDLSPEECIARAQAIAGGERPGGYIKHRTENSLTFEVRLMPDPGEWAAMGCLTIFTVGLGLVWVAFRILFAYTNKMEATMSFLVQKDGKTAIVVDSSAERYRRNLEEWARENLVA